MYRALLLVLCAQASFASLPLGLKACKKSSADFERCIARQTESAISRIKSGDKKHGISPVDPLMFETLVIEQSTGPVAINLVFKKFTFHGLSKCKVLNVTNDWKELKISLIFDKVVTTGSYKIQGKILILPIQGEGPSTLTWSNMTVNAKITLREINRKGKKYFDVAQFLVDIFPSKWTINLENLFNGDKTLGNHMNAFMNENWEAILKELKPSISRALSKGFSVISNQVFAKIPKNEIQIS